MLYAYKVDKTDEGYVGYMPDVDLETLPQPTEDEAVEAIKQGFSGYIEFTYRRRKKPIPLPATEPEERVMYTPVKLQLRILLWNAMLESHVTQTELAKKLGISRQHMSQFFTASNVSVEKFEEALTALEYYPHVSTISSD